MDGFFSALFAYNQLKKQGIKEKDITLKDIQYGFSGDDGKKMATKKGQALVVVDFAAIKMPDEKKEEDKDYKEEGQRNRKWTDKDQKELEEVRAKISDIRKDDKWKKLPKELSDKLEELKNKKYSPDFVSDHHNNDKGDLVKGTSGKIAASYKWTNNKEPFRSDSEHIAVSYANNIADWSSIEAVSKIDSADYSNLMDTLTLPTNFKNKGRMDRLANIVNSLLSKLIKKNPEATYELIRTSKPSLVSVYSNLKHSFKLNDLQIDGLEELQKESPNYKKVDEIRKQLPNGMRDKVTKEESGKLSTKERMGTPKDKTEEMRKKGDEDLEKSKTGYWSPKLQQELDRLKFDKKYLQDGNKKVPEETIKRIEELSKMKKEKQGDFQPVGSLVMRQDGGKTGRYTGALLSRNGKLAPFIVKRWGGSMVQVSANPQLPKEYRDRVNLNDDMQEVLKIIEDKYSTFKNKWAFEIVKKESGGHKGITTISGLGTLGLMVKPRRDELKAREEISKRATKVGLDKSKMPKHNERMKELKLMKDQASEERTNIMNQIEMEFYKLFSRKYSDFVIPAKGEHDIKEEWRNGVARLIDKD